MTTRTPYITKAEERVQLHTSPDFHDLLQSELYVIVLLSTFLVRHTNMKLESQFIFA